MQRKLRDRWLSALRRGHYKQTTGKLCRTDGDGKATYWQWRTER